MHAGYVPIDACVTVTIAIKRGDLGISTRGLPTVSQVFFIESNEFIALHAITMTIVSFGRVQVISNNLTE